MCYESLSESLPSFLSWQGIPFKHTVLFTEARENPLLSEEETTTQPGEILGLLAIRFIILRNHMCIDMLKGCPSKGN